MKINDIITKDGKEYKFVSVLEELQQKGMSSCALCDYRSHISVCEFGIKNLCLPNHCLKLNEQQKMKSNELSFKVITNSEYRNKTIIELLRKVGFPILHINQHASACFVNDNICSFLDVINSVFENLKIKEVTFDDAIKLLESCEPAEKKPTGKFVEYDIDENGCYHPLNDRGSSANCRWQDIHHYEDVNRIFAGWFWENPKDSNDDGWSLNRQGINRTTKSMTGICEDWQYPLIPTKIRFWVKE